MTQPNPWRSVSFWRKSIFVLVVLGAWQLSCSLGAEPKILLPSPVDVLSALSKAFSSEQMLEVLSYSLSLITVAMALGFLLALVCSMLAILSPSMRDIYNLILTVMDPIPSIAILPLAILWFGTGLETIVVIIIHSVIWPVSRNFIDGFSAVPKIYVEIGHNFGFKPYRMFKEIYLPAAMPYLISGIKVGWARAWRTLISAEMIFGATGALGGLGWFIFKKRYQLETDGVFATLLIIVIIGLVVEYGILQTLERKTIKKWGMVRS